MHSGGPAPPGAAQDAEILEAIAERIARETEAMAPHCLWCMKGTEGEPFCAPVCAEQWRRRIMPPPRLERVVVAQPAPPASVRAFALAFRAGRDRARWRQSHPEAAT
jgi:hypothetical protein